jgi:hypothetical protein
MVADDRTLRQLRTLAAIQCTQKEAAGVLGVSENFLCTFLGPTGSKIARESWEAGRQEGRASIRRKQYEMAMRGNITMLIWWGKNNLGRSDKIEKTETVDANISITNVQILQAPDLEAFDDKKIALRQFEAFRLKLAQAQPPQLPAPLPLLAHDAAPNVPIVSRAGPNPVAFGWAKTLARPGGRITGVFLSAATNAKQFGAKAQAIMEGLPLAKQKLMGHEYIAVVPGA